MFVSINKSIFTLLNTINLYIFLCCLGKLKKHLEKLKQMTFQMYINYNKHSFLYILIIIANFRNYYIHVCDNTYRNIYTVTV